MKCCCTYVNLGCFDICDNINTGVLTDETGIHVIEMSFMSIKLKKEVTLAIGDEIILPKIYLNENSEITFAVKKPSEYMNNCYSLTTKSCINVAS